MKEENKGEEKEEEEKEEENGEEEKEIKEEERGAGEGRRIYRIEGGLIWVQQRGEEEEMGLRWLSRDNN